MSSPVGKTGLLLAAAFLVLLGVCGFALYSLHGVQDMAELVSHTNLVLDQLDILRTNLWSAESALRGYAIAGNEEFLQPYEPALKNINSAYLELRRLTQDNPQQAKRVLELNKRLDAKLSWLSDLRATYREQGAAAAETMIRTGKGNELINLTMDSVASLGKEENRLLALRQSEQMLRTLRTYQALAVMGAVSGLVLILAFRMIVGHERERWRAEDKRQAAVLERGLAESTARERAEDLERFFNLSLDLMCITDRNGFFRQLNPAWKAVLGHELDAMEGRPFLHFVHPDDLDATQSAMADLTAGKKVLNFVNRLKCRDGSYRWIEWQSAPYQNRLVFSTARDVTGLRQAPAERQP